MKICEILDKSGYHISGSHVQVFEKDKLIGILFLMSGDEIQDFCTEIKELEDHKEATVGLWAIDKEPFDLLHEFWQRSSDACPLECTEAEKQQDDFHDWMIEKFFQIE